MSEMDMEQLINCALCPNMCRSDCPVLQVLKREAVSPARKARFTVMVRQGSLAVSDEILEAIAHCLGCQACTLRCPFPDLDLCSELLLSRLKEANLKSTLPAWEGYLLNLKKYSSPYGQIKANAYGKIGKANLLFFAGCTARANNPGGIEATTKLLEQAGIEYQMIAEDCCGFPADTWGDPDLSYQLALENSRKMADSGANAMLTNCPECWLTFTERYPALGMPLPLDIIDGPSFFHQLMQSGKLKVKSESTLKVSYHDPCIWARRVNKLNEPAEILKSIPGLTFAKIAASGKDTRCCGGGRMFQLSFPHTSNLLSERRLKDFPMDGTIVTACPFCREGLSREDRKPVLELVELLAAVCT